MGVKKICLILMVLLVSPLLLAQSDFATEQAERENISSSVTYESGKENPEQLPERWSSFLPIFGKEAKAKGYVLPYPFGVSITQLWQEQPMDIFSLEVQSPSNNASLNDAVQVYEFNAETTNTSLRLDAWLFPFLNLYVVGGITEGTGRGRIRIKPVPLLLPQGIDTDFTVEYESETVGAGATVAGGYRDFFGVLDINRTVTDNTLLINDIYTTVVSGRLGWNGTFYNDKSEEVFSGAFWVGFMDQYIDETIRVAVPGSDIVIELRGRPKQERNYLLGGRWNISDSWEMMLEGGFGPRKQVLGGLTYRF